MNRRQLLSAIPGLSLLARLRGKKEEPPADGYYDEKGRFWKTVDDDVAHMREHEAFLEFEYERECRRVLWNANPPVDVYGRKLYLGRDGRLYVNDVEGCPAGPFDPPTFAELSRQWDAT